jgi:hypothetical protein
VVVSARWAHNLLGVMLGTRGEGSWRGRCVCGTLQIVTMPDLKYSQNNKCEGPNERGGNHIVILCQPSCSF